MTNPTVSPEKTRLGWIGVGVMGASMCGHLRTAGYAAKLHKPCLHISLRVAQMHLARFLAENSTRTLNVAGNRESVAPGIYDRVLEVLSEALILAR